jgi:hypothetical protein
MGQGEMVNAGKKCALKGYGKGNNRGCFYGKD